MLWEGQGALLSDPPPLLFFARRQQVAYDSQGPTFSADLAQKILYFLGLWLVLDNRAQLEYSSDLPGKVLKSLSECCRSFFSLLEKHRCHTRTEAQPGS